MKRRTHANKGVVDKGIDTAVFEQPPSILCCRDVWLAIKRWMILNFPFHIRGKRILPISIYAYLHGTC